MGKRGRSQKSPSVSTGRHCNLTLRQESSGKKQFKVHANNSKAMLKLKHLQKLATWASGEASIPSLGAFFGNRFATYGESIDAPPDPSLFQCQRCETILQPGFNCTVRIEKCKAKTRRRCQKPKNAMQNNVVYKCHYCSHWNLRRGTPRDHMKEICPPNAKRNVISALAVGQGKVEPASIIDPEKVKTAHAVTTTLPIELENVEPSPTTHPEKVNSTPVVDPEKVISTHSENVKRASLEEVKSTLLMDLQNVTSPLVTDPEKVMEIKYDAAIQTDGKTSTETSSVAPLIDSPAPATPSVRPKLTLLDQKKRRRSKSTSKKTSKSDESSAKIEEENSVSASSKRRRKGWTSLKEIAEKNVRVDNSRNITNLTIPFFL